MLDLLLASFLCLAEPPPVSTMLNPRIMVVTKYTAGEESTGKLPSSPSFGITASGHSVRDGLTCAAGPSIPFGTWLAIEGLGFRIVHDRGGSVDDDSVDVYEEDLESAINFGRQYRNVYVLGG